MESNNEAEFNVVKHGLIIARREGLRKMVVEGDSSLVIDTNKKLNQGSQWENISKSWRNSRLIQDINELIQDFEYIIPTHSRRNGNKVADFLANWGCLHPGVNIDNPWINENGEAGMYQLTLTLNQDLSPNHNPQSGCKIVRGLLGFD